MSDSPQVTGVVRNGRAEPRVPRHGKGVLINFAPGVSGNPFGRGVKYQEVRRMAADMSREATLRLQQLMHNEDGRVSVVACNSLLERAFGKPKEHDPNDDKSPVRIDLSGLTLEQQKQLLAMIRQTVTVEEIGLAAPVETVTVMPVPTIDARAVTQVPPAATAKRKCGRPPKKPKRGAWQAEAAKAAKSPPAQEPAAPAGSGRLRLF